MKKINIGIIICDRYSSCAGGKCLRSLRNRDGAFDRYKGSEVELVGYTTCGGCPGGNVEQATGEMVENGADAVHLATGLVVGYPPCPYIDHFKSFIEERYDLEVVVGTHPIPQNYYETHLKIGTWEGPGWEDILRPTRADEKARRSYD
ncbi:MAG: CGGC domain-containing protein [Candidatus Bipolaricaulota bacterium]